MGKRHVHPYVESLILCDEVRHSGNTEGMPDGVYDLVGVRTTLQIPAGASFPYTHPALYLFLRAFGPVGMADGTITLYVEGQRRSLWELNVDGPLELWGFDRSAHHVAQIVDVEFPRAGVYRFKVRLNKGPGAEIRLLVE